MAVADKDRSDTSRRRREPEVRARPCHSCGSDDTRVYSTQRIVRYCKCRVCGATWTQAPRR